VTGVQTCALPISEHLKFNGKLHLPDIVSNDNIRRLSAYIKNMTFSPDEIKINSKLIGFTDLDETNTLKDDRLISGLMLISSMARKNKKKEVETRILNIIEEL
jgi:hypothetical protein